MGLLQRIFDAHGLATVSITQVREISELVLPSLACLVEHPFGLTLGAAGDDATHRAVLRACLAEATQPHSAGTIVDLGFHWDRDDLRERQLRKQAH
ncbi:MAG TPA: hypothetical protein VNC40_11870 [Gaiellaceae bacterium]|nr:hypothetical protein [Gaiellaceae bacterium]